MQKTIKVVRRNPLCPGRSGWWYIVGQKGKCILGGLICTQSVADLYSSPRGGKAEFKVSTTKPRDDDEYHTFVRERGRPGGCWFVTDVRGYGPRLMQRASGYLTKQFPGHNKLYISMYGD